jgi:hypothetical protein
MCVVAGGRVVGAGEVMRALPKAGGVGMMR